VALGVGDVEDVGVIGIETSEALAVESVEYRLRWLEENYQAGVLEKYAPCKIDACSTHKIA
jgi:hypothetical protein